MNKMKTKTTMNTCEPSISSSDVTAKEAKMSMRRIVSIPLLIFAVLAEIAIIAYTWKYESSVVPVGVFTIFGLSIVGGTLLVVELLKLPLAIYFAGSSRIGKSVGIVGLALICLVTWHTVKDAFTNEIVVSMEPSKKLHDEADRLESRNTSLSQGLAGLKQENSETAIDRDEIIAHAEKLASVQAERRKELDQQFEQRIQSLQSSTLLTPSEQARQQQLLASRSRIEAESASRISEIESLIQSEINRSEAFSETSGFHHKHQLVAWKSQVDMMRVQHADAVAAWTQECESLKAAHEIKLSNYLNLSDLYTQNIKNLHDELAVEKQMHIHNDGLFYDLNGKIQEAENRTSEKCASIQQKLDALGAPPALELPKSPPSLVMPPQPVMQVHDNNEMKRLKAMRNDAIANRDSSASQVDLEIQTLMTSALSRSESEGISDSIASKLAKIKEQREYALESVDAEIQAIHAGRQSQLALLDDAAVNAAMRLESSRSARQEIATNEEDIAGLRLDADESLRATNVFRMATFLKYFMPQASEKERMEFFQSWIVPCICFFPAFLPAFFLELSVSRFSPKRPSPPRRFIGLLGKARSKRRFRVRTLRLAESRTIQAATESENKIEKLKQDSKLAIQAEKNKVDAKISSIKEDSARQIKSFENKVNQAKAGFRKKEEEHSAKLQKIESDAAQQIIQIRSDSDRAVIEAKADRKISSAEVKLANDKIGYIEKLSESRIHEIQATANEIAMNQVEAEIDALKKRESSMDIQLSRKEVEIKSLHNQERVAAETICKLREDNSNLAQCQMSITVVDDEIKKRAG